MTIITITRTYRLLYVTLAKRSLRPDPISQTVIYSSDEPLSKNITNVLVIRSEFSSLKRKRRRRRRRRGKKTIFVPLLRVVSRGTQGGEGTSTT